ncbi:GTPase-associated protein 1-related protein [Kitasatospora kifunensis]|uniref:Uncharacterized protein n=1 Tax=Kitasatospora kifunensis TaxID=58351 RepID=A0A7W7VZB3_KITKI|nr:GTPase-associated protein 1-related protein [Kitasatospora kifunensis]MBB4927554.1 hypothetical protein [Kitasatospora kifunensis]
MAFQQLYYTSCEHGLSGYAGYQFNAVTPEVSAETMRQVEALTAYEPPRSLLNSQTPQELARCPVNLVHVPGSPCLSARVGYVGRDSARRFGNYFVHALSTADFGHDGGGRLGIELWDSPLWRSTPVESTQLPELTSVPPGPLSRPAVGRFLREHPHGELLGPLLAATLDALAHERTVLLVEHDSDRVAHWFAALCYLLPPPLARQLSFATYLHRPDRARLHLVGTVPEIRIDLGPDQQDAFHLLDLVQGRVPQLPTHPLVRLLARIDLPAARIFWARTEEYLLGDEQVADDWHGPAAATAAAGGTPLTQQDITAVIAWLKRADWLPDPAVGAVIGNLHRQQRLSREQLAELIRTARAAGLPALTQQLTGEVVEHDLLLFRDGSPQALELVPITDPQQRTQTTALWLTLFQAAHGSAALRLLAWADGAGLTPPEPELARHGARITEQLLATAVTANSLAGLAQPLSAAVQRWPGFRLGLVDAVLRLEGGRPGQFREVLRMLPAELITAEDLAGRRALLEDFLVVRVERRPQLAVQALLEILRLRGTGLLDLVLLQSLWPGSGNRWSHSEALALLPRLAPDLRWDAGARQWLAATVLREVPGALELANFLLLSEMLAVPARDSWLTNDAKRCVGYTMELQRLLEQAQSADRLAKLLDRPPPEHWLPAWALLRRRLPRALADRMVLDPIATGALLGELDQLDQRTTHAYLTLLNEQTRRVGRATPASPPLISHLAAISCTPLAEEPRALVKATLEHARDHWPAADLARLVRTLEPVHQLWAEHLARALAQRQPTVGQRVTSWLPGRRRQPDGTRPAPQTPEE